LCNNIWVNNNDNVQFSWCKRRWRLLQDGHFSKKFHAVAIYKRAQLARIRSNTEIQEPPLLCYGVPKYRVVSNTLFIVIISLDVQFNVQIRLIKLRTDPGGDNFLTKLFYSIKQRYSDLVHVFLLIHFIAIQTTYLQDT
jgi:hypothetical protein